MVKNYTFRHILLVLVAMVTAFAMPAKADDSLPYPYIWNSETSPSDFVSSGTAWDDWKWASQYDGFQIMSAKNNWPDKYLITARPVAFPDKKEPAQLTFWYNASQDLTIYVKHEVDGKQVELGHLDVTGTQGDYIYARIGFEADKPEKIIVSAILTGGNGNCYGTLVLRELQITSAANSDMAIASFDAPFSSRLAAGHDNPVRATFENISGIEITNPVFAYSLGDKTVRETYDGSVAPGETYSYTFKTPLNEPDGTRAELKLWCEVDGDVDTSNNSLTVGEMLFYQPCSFPYFTDFNDGLNFWTIYDANGSWPWEFVQIDDNGTPNNVLGYAMSYGSYDDYAITPAISLPAGKHRISFYQAGLGGDGHLTVNCGTTPNPADMTMTIHDADVDNIGWANKYATFEVPSDGLYYFSFHLTGGSDQVCVDRLYIDDYDDLCIKSVDFDTKSGYNKTDARVILSYTNHGLTPQNNIKVRYSLDGLNTFVEETVTESVAPGETISHTFATPVDLSEKDHTYTLTGKIESAVGIDTFNDAMTGASLTHYKNESVPYSTYFNDADQFGKWQFASSDEKSGWNIASSTYPYAGKTEYYEGIQAYVLQHTNKSGAKADSWAWSECIDLPAGTYDLSFFYRTPNYKSLPQNFKVALCADTDPNAEKIEIAEFSDVLHTSLEYRKYEGLVTIEKDGAYFIGFNNISESGDGGTMIDMITLRQHPEALSLPYESNLPEGAAEWEAYDLSDHFIQWNITPNGFNTAREVFADGVALYTFSEGMLVTPRIAMTPGQEVKVDIDYDLTTDSDKVGLCLYTAEKNLPEQFKLVDVFAENGANTHSFTFVPTSDEIYFGIRSNMTRDDDELLLPYNYNITIKNVKVAYTHNNDGIGDLPADTSLSIEGDRIHCQGASISVYSASGMLLASGHDMVGIDGYKGVAIIKIAVGNGVSTIKHLF